jgi:energy-converting hydrogenase Eha subunit C
MTQPYQRVVVLHIAIILGGIGAIALGSPLWALLVLLAMKIGLDLKAHLKEHSKS